MLNLPVRRESMLENKAQVTIESCEICNVSDVNLDDAHWFASTHGGSKKFYNILKLCPNCHRKLDRDDPITIELCREKLLFREVKKLIESNSATPKRLRNLVEAILHRKQLE
jgi:predicted restriction endonuclease